MKKANSKDETSETKSIRNKKVNSETHNDSIKEVEYCVWCPRELVYSTSHVSMYGSPNTLSDAGQVSKERAEPRRNDGARKSKSCYYPKEGSGVEFNLGSEGASASDDTSAVRMTLGDGAVNTAERAKKHTEIAILRKRCASAVDTSHMVEDVFETYGGNEKSCVSSRMTSKYTTSQLTTSEELSCELTSCHPPFSQRVTRSSNQCRDGISGNKMKLGEGNAKRSAPRIWRPKSMSELMSSGDNAMKGKGKTDLGSSSCFDNPVSNMGSLDELHSGDESSKENIIKFQKRHYILYNQNKPQQKSVWSGLKKICFLHFLVH